MNEQSVLSFSESNSTDQKSLKIKWNSVQNPATAMSEGRSMTIGTGKLLYGTCHDLNTVNSLIATPFRKQPPLTLETSEASATFFFTTKTTQPRPQVFSVTVP